MIKYLGMSVWQGSMASKYKSFTLMSILFAMVFSLKEEENAPSCQEKNRDWCWCLIRYNYKGIPHQTILKLEEEEIAISFME